MITDTLGLIFHHPILCLLFSRILYVDLLHWFPLHSFSFFPFCCFESSAFLLLWKWKYYTIFISVSISKQAILTEKSKIKVTWLYNLPSIQHKGFIAVYLIFPSQPSHYRCLAFSLLLALILLNSPSNHIVIFYTKFILLISHLSSIFSFPYCFLYLIFLFHFDFFLTEVHPLTVTALGFMNVKSTLACLEMSFLPSLFNGSLAEPAVVNGYPPQHPEDHSSFHFSLYHFL
jgi:hypothetical protein